MMTRGNALAWGLLIALATCLAASATAQQQPAAPAPGASPAPAATTAAPPALEPKAIEILKASSSRLAAAKTMSFTAVGCDATTRPPRPPRTYPPRPQGA